MQSRDYLKFGLEGRNKSWSVNLHTHARTHA